MPREHRGGVNMYLHSVSISTVGRSEVVKVTFRRFTLGKEPR
jgi:hypothetical protein